MILLVATALLAQASVGNAQGALDTTAAEVALLCKAVLCRVPAPIQLKLEGGKLFEMTPPAPMPIVTGDYVTILAGEEVLVEAAVKDGRLVNLVAVGQMSHPERTLVFSLRQEPSLSDGTGMVLKVTSPFPRVLKYRLGMMLPSEASVRKTSSCPLGQGTPAFEHWPYPIFQVLAGRFRFVEPDSDEAKTCE